MRLPSPVTFLAVVAMGLLAACGGNEAGGPPQVAGAAYEADRQPYDENLDASAAVEAALRTARAENKLVLVKMGGNWCPDCQVLSGMMEVDGIKALLDERYEVVKVDVGRLAPDGAYARNRDVAERFGMAGFQGVPTLVIATPSGQVLNASEPSIFRDARDRDPQDLADYLYRYAAGTDRNRGIGGGAEDDDTTG